MMQQTGESLDQYRVTQSRLRNSTFLNERRVQVGVESGISCCIETRDEAGATDPVNADAERAMTENAR
ncbi:MAG: hypothetical protein MK110_18870 [Fuerstiella sp.]|nr:hypothetical protein [Fuerstiella sp.]